MRVYDLETSPANPVNSPTYPTYSGRKRKDPAPGRAPVAQIQDAFKFFLLLFSVLLFLLLILLLLSRRRIDTVLSSLS